MSEPALRKTSWVCELTGLDARALEALVTESREPVPGRLRVRYIGRPARPGARPHRYWVVRDVLELAGGVATKSPEG